MPPRRLSLLLLLVVACGNEDEPSSSETVTVSASRVDEARALGGLTPHEQTLLCEDVQTWTREVTEHPAYVAGLCLHQAITGASVAASAGLTLEQTRMRCAEIESQCAMARSSAMPLPSSRGCAYATDCAATVGDVKACTVGTSGGYAELVQSLPACSAMESDTTTHIDTTPLTRAAPACTRVLACGAPT